MGVVCIEIYDVHNIGLSIFINKTDKRFLNCL